MNPGRLTVRVLAAGALLAAVATWASGDPARPNDGAVATGASYEIHRQTVDGGGTTVGSGQDYTLSGTVGQPDAGVASGGDYQLFGAFWFPVVPGDVGEDGAVGPSDYAAFVDCSTGPGNGSLLEECQAFDVDHSGAIDLADFAEIQVFYAGP